MENSLFVGNLPESVGDDELETAFSDYGSVVSAVVIRDGETGQSKGCGLVEMKTRKMAESARGAMDGVELDGRRLWVNHTSTRGERQRRSDYGELW